MEHLEGLINRLQEASFNTGAAYSRFVRVDAEYGEDSEEARLLRLLWEERTQEERILRTEIYNAMEALTPLAR